MQGKRPRCVRARPPSQHPEQGLRPVYLEARALRAGTAASPCPQHSVVGQSGQGQAAPTPVRRAGRCGRARKEAVPDPLFWVLFLFLITAFFSNGWLLCAL